METFQPRFYSSDYWSQTRIVLCEDINILTFHIVATAHQKLLRDPP